ncbi:MAG: hypothetical protein RL291_1402 [Pseudomonadota bacterium]|jgi:protein-tyrosine phosphatase
MAEGVFRQVIEDLDRNHVFVIDSAGTHAGQLERAPDPRAQDATRHRGVDITDQLSRNISADDFHRFDHILALDKTVKSALEAMAPDGHQANVALLMDFAAHMGTDEVPDPWSGTQADYEHALDLISEATCGLAEHLTGDQLK